MEMRLSLDISHWRIGKKRKRLLPIIETLHLFLGF
jgi:hypothetical protein